MSTPSRLRDAGPLRRLADIALALVLLALALIPLLLVAAAIKLDSRGPVLFRQRRVGRGGQLFTILKLRTMTSGAERQGAVVSGVYDARVTRVGRVLRAAKVDELPQLWNVLRGEMAVIGPRPEVPDMVRYYDARERDVLLVRPGLTCPGQMYFSSTQAAELNSVDDVEGYYIAHQLHEKLALDLAYLERRTWRTDAALMARTCWLLVLQCRAVLRSSPSELAGS